MENVYERPFKPASIHLDTARAFPLSAPTEQLKSEGAFRDSGRDALTLVHDPSLTMVLTVVRGGTACGEHRPAGPTAIIVLSGTITLTVPRAETPTVLEGGSMAAVGRDFAHVVAAKTDAAFLTVIGPQRS